MQYTFRPAAAGTHRRLSDATLGILREFPDSVRIESATPVLASAAGYERVIPLPIVVAIAPFDVSKIKLLDALDAIGLEDALFAFLATDEKLLRRFNAAQVLVSTDPLLVAAIPLFAAASGKSVEEINALLQSSRGL